MEAIGNVIKAKNDLGTALTPPGPAAPTPTPGADAAKKAEQDQAVKKMWNSLPPVPKAKGGPVKAGGAPTKNVDNSGMTKEPC
jgi:hypothetical protein